MRRQIIFSLTILVSHFCFSQNYTHVYEKNSWQKIYKSLLADKAAELAQTDLCLFYAFFAGEDESFCLKAEHLCLSRAAAKGAGTSVRAIYMEEGVYAVEAALAAGYFGSKLSDTLIASSQGAVSMLMFAASINIVAQQIQARKNEIEENLYTPFFYKIFKIGFIIALEKRMENFLFSRTTKSVIGRFFQRYQSQFSSRKITGLSNVVATGTAKVGVALLIFLTATSANWIIDQLANFLGIKIFLDAEKNRWPDWKTTIETSVFQGFAVPLILIFVPPMIVSLMMMMLLR